MARDFPCLHTQKNPIQNWVGTSSPVDVLNFLEHRGQRADEKVLTFPSETGPAPRHPHIGMKFNPPTIRVPTCVTKIFLKLFLCVTLRTKHVSSPSSGVLVIDRRYPETTFPCVPTLSRKAPRLPLFLSYARLISRNKASGDQNMKSEEKKEIWDPVKVICWSVPLTPIFGACLTAKNWKSAGFVARAEISMRWFYACLVYYATLPATAPFLSTRSFHPTLVELTMITLPLVAWTALEGVPQVRFSKKERSSLSLEKSWRIPLTVAFGIVLGMVGLLVSTGIALTLISLPV